MAGAGARGLLAAIAARGLPAAVTRRGGMAVGDATVLVTGATGGIGAATARALAQRGARLLLSGRRADALGALAADLRAADLRAADLRAEVLVADLSDRDDVRRLADQARAAGVDILVANAALPASGLLLELTPEQIDRMLDVNLRAPIALARALAPGMIARGRGHMVFVSSLSGKTAAPASSLYSATKFGLRGFALGLREDLRRDGVGVSVIAPGFIRDAGMFADSGVTLPAGVGTRSPQDVAAAVIHAIERDRAEVDVAPLALRLGAAFGSVAPAAAASASRLLGSDRIAADFADRQRDLR
jgi:short-subunit dehydrogenase